MNIPFIDAQLDQSWQLQGRIIPPSCTSGDGCILHLQTRLHSWANGHFHTGRISINAEAGVEFAMSMTDPPDPNMNVGSLDSIERGKEVEYLVMAKLHQPEDAIAFATINGLTIVIYNKGFSGLFGPSEKCKDCKAQESVALIVTQDTRAFDSLMRISSAERSH